MTPITTNWSVVTGSPCSGKTSVAIELEKRGYPVRPEFARIYFDGELAKGRTLAEICADQLALQQTFLYEGMKLDEALDVHSSYILDRSPVDAVAHYMLYDLPYGDAWEKAKTFQYKHVFYLEKLPYSQDAVRVEDEETAARLDKCFIKTYEMLGYTLINVPVMSIEERADFIESYIKGTSL